MARIVKGNWISALVASFVGLSAQVLAAQAVSLSPTFNGESIALQVNITGSTPLILDDSGPGPVAGGLSQNSLWDAITYGINGRGFYAMSDGSQGIDHSSSSITLLDITVGRHRLVTQYVTVDAFARIEFSGMATSGTTHILQLSVDGRAIVPSGLPNQRVKFPDGYLLVNEQLVSGDGRTSRTITVNGLHLVVTGVGDVIVGSVRAGVAKPLGS